MTVKRDEWKAEPMPSGRIVAYQRRLSPREVLGLQRGFRPLGMDDKWFIFSEDEVVHLHRSWTGEEIYAFRLDVADDGHAEIREVRVNNEYPDDKQATDILDLMFEKILPEYYES